MSQRKMKTKMKNKASILLPTVKCGLMDAIPVLFEMEKLQAVPSSTVKVFQKHHTALSRSNPSIQMDASSGGTAATTAASSMANSNIVHRNLAS